MTKRSPPETKKEEKMRNKQYPQKTSTNKHQSSETDREYSHHPIRGPTHRPAVKEESNVMNYNWVNISLQTAHAVTYFPATSDNPSKPLRETDINPSRAEHDIPCLSKQCRSRSVGFFRSQLIWICTVYH